MARVHDTYLKQFQTMSKTALKDPIVFVVDMINGFIKEGALHDSAIFECVKEIQALVKENDMASIFIADAHPPLTREFQSYPAHCVIGTSESEVVEELQPYMEHLFHKNSTNTFTCPDFQNFLKTDMDQYRDIIITGCCSDLCVLQFALCLNAWLNEHNKSEVRIIIPIDCIETYHIEGVHDAVSMNEFAISNMAMNGIHIVTHMEGRTA